MTPLFKKLNLGEHETILVLKVPESFEAELELLNGVSILRKPPKKPSKLFAIGFALTKLELDEVSAKLVNATTGDAIIWVASPSRVTDWLGKLAENNGDCSKSLSRNN